MLDLYADMPTDYKAWWGLGGGVYGAVTILIHYE